MKNLFVIRLSICIPLCLLIIGCSKNYTSYYADAENSGLAIFSDKGNELMTCFVAGKAWQTNNRATSGFSGGTSYEVYIDRQITNSAFDTLNIRWGGHYADNSNSGVIGLALPVPKNFTYRSFAGFAGQRLHIDTTNGFFSTGMTGLNNDRLKGRGDIYFHSARFDSIGPGQFEGIMSGLFEADFGSFKITRGRFDHSLVLANTSF